MKGLREIICPFAFKGRRGAVNPPVFENLERALILPAVPIWKTEDVVMLSILILLMMILWFT